MVKERRGQKDGEACRVWLLFLSTKEPADSFQKDPAECRAELRSGEGSEEANPSGRGNCLSLGQ